MTPCTVAHQAPLSMGFSRQEYWSRLWFPSPEDLPEPQIKPRSPALQTDSLSSEQPGKTFSFLTFVYVLIFFIQVILCTVKGTDCVCKIWHLGFCFHWETTTACLDKSTNYIHIFHYLIQISFCSTGFSFSKNIVSTRTPGIKIYHPQNTVSLQWWTIKLDL